MFETSVPKIIVKFGQKDHLKALQAGNFYLKPSEWFKNCENVHQRDSLEGSNRLFNPNKTSIMINGYRLTSKGGTINASLSFPHQRLYVFCASALYIGDSIREDRKIFDDKIKQFGDSFLVIPNVNELLRRIRDSLEKLKCLGNIECFVANRIDYFNTLDYDGEVGIFRKSSDFEWQKEWRLAVKSIRETDYFEFTTEPLHDISYFNKTENFINVVAQNPNGTNMLKFS